MSLKIYSTVDKLVANDERVVQQAGDTDGVIASFYDLSGNPSLFMSGATANLGYVGIKTIQPNTELTVAGNVSASGSFYGDGSHLSNVFNQSLNTSNNVQFNQVTTTKVVGGNYEANQLILPVGFGPTLAGLAEGNVFIQTGTSDPANYLSWKFDHSDRSFTLPSSGLIKTIDGTSVSFTSSVSSPALSGNHYGDGSALTGVVKTDDSRLTNSRNPNGTASGDLSGSYPSPTVSKIQGFDVSTSTPSNGQILQWNGTAWVPGSIATGGSGGGGVTYYFDYGNYTGISPTSGLPASPVSPSLLGREYSVGAGSLQSDNLTENVYTLVAGFVTLSSEPAVTSIPAGIWDFNIWADIVGNSSVNQTSMQIRVYKYISSTSTYTPLASSEDLYIYDPTVIAQYIASVTMPQTTILSSDRIYIEFWAAKSVNQSRAIRFWFDSSHPSHVHTTIPSVAGSGLVKTINGVYQTPASLLVDADVASNAAIAQSKISGLATSLAGKVNTTDVIALTAGGTGSATASGGLSNLGGLPKTGGTLTGGLTGTTATFSTSISSPSLYGDGGSLTGLNATNIASGTLNNSRLPAIATFTTSVSSPALSGNHYGDGSPLTNLNATNIASGTLSNARLSAIATFTTSVSSPNVYGTHNGDGSALTNLNATNIASGTLNNSRLPAIATFTTSVSSPALSGNHYGDGSKLTGVVLTTGGTINGDLNITGNLSALGTTTQIDTMVFVTSAVSVTNTGTGPALYVKQTGSNDVASFYDDTTSALIIKDGGYVGIGTASPDRRLVIEGDSGVSSDVVIRSVETTTTTNNGPVIIFQNKTNASGGYVRTGNNVGGIDARAFTTVPSLTGTDGYYVIGSMVFDAEGDFNSINTAHGGIVFNTSLSGVRSQKMRIAGSGNVGIGDDSPDSKLSIISTSNNQAAVIINQTGTAPALVVEDSTSPDSTPFTIDADGNVLIGLSATYATPFNHPFQISRAGSSGITIARFSNDTTQGTLRFAKSRGTVNGTFGGGLSAGDNIGVLDFYGDNGALSTTKTAYMALEADGLFTASSAPSRFTFATTAANSITPTEHLRITSDGLVGIGTTTPSEELTVVGNVKATGDVYVGSSGLVSSSSSQIYMSGTGNATSLFLVGSVGDVWKNQSPTSYSTAVTATVAAVRQGIIRWTGAALTLTMPNGSSMDSAAFPFSGTMMEFSVINTGTGSVTLGTNTGVTFVGSAIVTNGTSGRFGMVSSGSGVYIVYRLS